MITIHDFKQVQMRVAEVIAANKVAGADKLLQLTLDFGDEARTALICLAEPPAVQQLEQEARETLDSRIKVFGKMDLPQLNERLQDWIETQIGV